MRKVGLARALSKLGYCSRSRAEELIRAGHVRINGVVRKDAEAPVHIGKDRLEIDGERIPQLDKVYLMLNKPRGVVTTANDEQGRETIYDFLDKKLGWVAPVGRLDKASEGLLLLTNDPEWGARINAPHSHVEKTYHVHLGGQLTIEQIQKLEKGFAVANAESLRVKKATLLRSGQRNCWMEIVLDEGRNRHIRRMFETMNIEVLRLVRVGIGALKLGDLAKGTARALNAGDRMLLFTKNEASEIHSNDDAAHLNIRIRAYP